MHIVYTDINTTRVSIVIQLNRTTPATTITNIVIPSQVFSSSPVTPTSGYHLSKMYNSNGTEIQSTITACFYSYQTASAISSVVSKVVLSTVIVTSNDGMNGPAVQDGGGPGVELSFVSAVD